MQQVKEQPYQLLDWRDDLVVAHGYPLSQQILRTDVAGMPLEWVDYREAARLYHTEQVAYTCGTLLYRLYGGTCAKTGQRTIVDVNSIIATLGVTGNPGNLRGSSEPVPMRVNTNLRMMTKEMVQELQRLDHRASGAPQYVFMRRDGLPLHPRLQAPGLHYFEW